jgi:glycosyltransferase involved in cell wall biosynthesis
MRYKVFRIATVPQSLHQLVKPQLDYLQNDFEMITASGPFDQENINDYEKWEYKHYDIPLTRKMTPLKDLKAIIQLQRIIKREKVDIVHTLTPKAGFIGMLAAFLAGTKIRLHTVTGLKFSGTGGMQKKLLIAFEKLTYKLAHQVMPNSQGVYNYIIENKLCKPGKLKMLANGATIGIDLNKYSRTPEIEHAAEKIKEASHISNEDFICCFIGRITKQKGIEELITAFQQIFPVHKNVKLILLGRYEQHLDPIDEKFVTEIKSNPRIIHFGFQTDIRPHLALSHLFVFPSYREGLPNVVLQAGSFDLPCVVTDIPGSNEIIKDEYNGLIVPAKDADSLAKAVFRLIEDEKLRKKMNTCAREAVITKYDQTLILQSLKDEYYKWLNKKTEYLNEKSL